MTGPKVLRKSTAMMAAPMIRDRPLEMAAPAIPMAGMGPRPLMST